MQHTRSEVEQRPTHTETRHEAVMLNEALEWLQVKPGGRYLDGTLGGGGHTRELLERSAPTGRVISLDVNRRALESASKNLAAYGDRAVLVEENFRWLDRIAEERDLVPLDGVFLDLGFSSDELEDPRLGLSFTKDGPLDMRFGPKSNDDGLTAAEVVNSWSQDDLETVIRNFGEERFARRIAAKIVSARKSARIIRTLELASIVQAAVPKQYEGGRIHPATRTFQALRIVVNDEVQALKQAIAAAHRVLAPEGRLVIISFHSIEDRIVKLAFNHADEWEVLTKKPVVATEEEIQKNPRARSAKLRAAKKIKA